MRYSTKDFFMKIKLSSKLYFGLAKKTYNLIIPKVIKVNIKILRSAPPSHKYEEKNGFFFKL